MGPGPASQPLAGGWKKIVCIPLFIPVKLLCRQFYSQRGHMRRQWAVGRRSA